MQENKRLLKICSIFHTNQLALVNILAIEQFLLFYNLQADYVLFACKSDLL